MKGQLVLDEQFTRNAPLGTGSDVYSSFKTYDGTTPGDTSKRGIYGTGRTITVANGRCDVHLHTEGGKH